MSMAEPVSALRKPIGTRGLYYTVLNRQDQQRN